MNNYRQRQSQAREKAIEWQCDFSNSSYSYLELVEYQNYFEKLGRRYGLLKEFRENGIC